MDGRGGHGLDRAGADGVDAHAALAEVHGQVAHAGFQGRLGHAHGVVVGDDPARAIVAERHDRGAGRKKRLKGPAQSDKRIGRDIEGHAEALAAGVDEPAGQILAVGVGDGMDQTVHAAELFADEPGGGGDFLVAGDVALKDALGPEFGGDGFDALADGFGGVAKGQPGPLLAQDLGDAVSDAAFVDHAENHDFFIPHQHGVSPCRKARRFASGAAGAAQRLQKLCQIPARRRDNAPPLTQVGFPKGLSPFGRRRQVFSSPGIASKKSTSDISQATD